MQKEANHIKWIQLFQKACLLIVLLVYLIIPFKKHFLGSAHFISHLASFENPIHSHDHFIQEHSPEDVDHHVHHHGYLDFLSHALGEFKEEQEALPIELVNYRFQVEIPSKIFQFTEQFPIIFEKTYQHLHIKLLTNPSFEVPTPPP